MPRKNEIVYRFQIVLLGIDPPVWRRIEVPASYSFWDLHVAIQDAMGWMDCHLHLFNVKRSSGSKPIQVGIPDDDSGAEIKAGWETPISNCFTEPGRSVEYEYDFGDGWVHRVLMEGILLAEDGIKYPRCLDGERACPPEDCGGVGGYARMLEVPADPNTGEHDDMVTWLKGHDKNYYPFDPGRFESHAVVFSDPKKRFKRAFGR